MKTILLFYTNKEDNVNAEVILQNAEVGFNTQSIAKLFHV